MAALVKGSPMYLEGREDGVKPKNLMMFLWVMLGVLKKNIFYFPRLILVSEAAKK